MRSWAKSSAFLAAAWALGLAHAAWAGTIEVVSADAEHEKAHPHALAPALSDDFAGVMDRVFGPGRWRETGGYRTPAQENALRRQGAGTVAPGRLSRHSLGDPQAPGAYDVVVAGMSPSEAAAKLRRAGGPIAKVAAEAAHGPQGPHLHIELASVSIRAQAGAPSD